MLRNTLLAVAVAVSALVLTQAGVRSSEAMSFGALPSPAVKEIKAPVELAGRRGAGRQYYYRGGYRGRYANRGGYGRYYGRYGYRYPRYYSGYRYPYYYGGYGYPAWGYGGVGIALGFGNYYGYDDDYDGGYADDGGSAHVRWCLNRYRSYNPRTDTFLGYDGYRHRCRGPY